MKRTAIAAITLCLALLATPALSQRPRSKRRPAATKPAKPPIDFSDIAEKDEWVKVAESNVSDFYSNPAKISRTSAGTMKIWIKDRSKTAYFSEWQAHQYKLREGEYIDKERYRGLAYVLSLYEVDCDKEQMRLLNRVDYDAEGNDLGNFARHDDRGSGWEAVVPDSVGEMIASEACRRR